MVGSGSKKSEQTIKKTKTKKSTTAILAPRINKANKIFPQYTETPTSRDRTWRAESPAAARAVSFSIGLLHSSMF